MPIYEYVCDNCGHEFEHLVRADEQPECPSCGKKRLTKRFSVAAAHTSSSGPSCPARDAGACGVQNCCGGQCGMAQWG
jgi:putative FmdB family regulatory protein